MLLCQDTHSSTLRELNDEHISLIKGHELTLSTLKSDHADQLLKLTSSMQRVAQKKEEQHEEVREGEGGE